MALVPINVGVPTGTVMWYCGTEAPIGWLVCDGGTASIEEYPVLADYLGDTYGPVGPVSFYLPDLVGKFVRGYSENYGRAFGSTEEDMFRTHSHGIPLTTHTHPTTDPGHKHDVSLSQHEHQSTSDHLHNNTNPAHYHSIIFPTNGYIFPFIIYADCDEEVMYTGYPKCSASWGSFGGLCPLCPAADKTKSSETGYTNISLVSTTTGITLNNAFTGVAMLKAFCDFSPTSVETTGISVNTFGTLNTRPVNVSLLPIIRT